MRGGASREALGRVQAEVEKEKAEALGRAGERLEKALRALSMLRDEVEALEGGRATPADGLRPREAAARRRGEYAAVLRAAQEYRHHLIVQREAVGFRRHAEVDRRYPVPPPLRPPVS